MLFEAASNEIPLLLFTLLVPTGLMGLALLACCRGFFESPAGATGADAGTRTLDRLSLVPVAFILIGLIASVFHVGSPAHIFNMFAGIGTSPLSNEIAAAGVSIVVAVVYGIAACAKPLGAGAHKAFGIALAILAVITSVLTGLAYMIETVVTWSTPYGTVSQLSLALLGGSVLAGAVLALAKRDTSKATNTLLAVLGIVGVAGIAATLALQGGVAQGAMSSTGATLAGVMGSYAGVAVAAVACAVIGVALLVMSARRTSGNAAMATLSLVLVLVALVCTRIDFYGIFLSVGL